MTKQAVRNEGCFRKISPSTLAAKVGGVRRCTPISVPGYNGEPVMCDEKISQKVLVDRKTYVGGLYLVSAEKLDPVEVLLGTDWRLSMHHGLAECDKANRVYVSELLAEYGQCLSSNIHDIGTA